MSLTKLNYEKENFEVIVVNDGNDRADRTVFCFKHQLNIDLIECKQLGPAEARNKGAVTAKGNYLAFIDDDCTVSTDWLNVLEQHLKWFPNSLIGGNTVNGLKDNIYSEASQLIIDYLYNYYNKINGSAKFVTSNNFALTRVRFNEVGGFNKNFPIPGGEDRHFCKKWLNYGYKIIYEPKAIINHWHKLDIEKFWVQQFNYGKGAYIFKTRLTEKNEFEPKIFYIKLLLYPIKAASKKKLELTILFIISQIAILSGIICQHHHRSRAQQPNT